MNIWENTEKKTSAEKSKNAQKGQGRETVPYNFFLRHYG